ncbi:MAG TPA: potassium transporter TrkG [Burkholderiales bacterium]|nr:potassium transporter TrkG [Burkholderiales bacterium]
MIFAAMMLVPLAVSYALQDGATRAHAEAFVYTGLAGAAAWVLTRHVRADLQTRDGFIFVALVWTVLPAFATLPLLRLLPELSFTKAYFEAMSGLTATGATVLSGLDALPASLNLWRTQLQWLGGMGVIVLVVAILPLLGVGGRQILRAETPGPMKETQLTPRIAQTAKGLWYVYAALTLLCMLGYRLAGMEWIEALTHAFSTVSLGGYSSHDASFAHFNSAAIEAVAIAFMLAGAINFATHFLALRHASLRPYRLDAEAKAVLAVVLGSALMVAGYLYAAGVYGDFHVALRAAAFNVVSAATTTGYATVDYNAWPIFAPLWMLLLSSFCSCSLSTGGGIKMMRALLMFQQALRELTRMVHPRAMVPVKLGGRVVESTIIFAVLAYMLIYGVTLTATTIAFAATGFDFLTAFSAAAACLNNLGPGLGQVGPASNYASLTTVQAWIATAAMMLGRLELITVFVLLSPAFWRK